MKKVILVLMATVILNLYGCSSVNDNNYITEIYEYIQYKVNKKWKKDGGEYVTFYFFNNINTSQGFLCVNGIDIAPNDINNYEEYLEERTDDIYSEYEKEEINRSINVINGYPILKYKFSLIDDTDNRNIVDGVHLLVNNKYYFIRITTTETLYDQQKAMIDYVLNSVAVNPTSSDKDEDDTINSNQTEPFATDSLEIYAATIKETSSNNLIGQEPQSWEEYYTEDEYCKYTTPASENGLNGTLLKIPGIVEKTDVDENYLYTFLNNNDDKWLIIFDTSVWENLNIDADDSIIIYGEYMGVSGKYNDLPAIFPYRINSKNNIYSASALGVELGSAKEINNVVEEQSFGNNTYTIESYEEVKLNINKNWVKKDIDDKTYYYFNEYNPSEGMIMLSNIVYENHEVFNIAMITNYYAKFFGLIIESQLDNSDNSKEIAHKYYNDRDNDYRGFYFEYSCEIEGDHYIITQLSKVFPFEHKVVPCKV